MDAANSEIVIEEILPVTTIGNAIVYEKLQNHLDGCFTMERQVLAIAGHDLSVLLESLLDGGSITALVLDESFGSDIDDVVACSLTKFTVPS